MAEELERPLTLEEAAARSGRHINTILRWVYSGQLKTCNRPLGVKRGKFVTISDLELACTTKLVQFKQPRRPHLARKREKDKQRYHEKYKHDPEYKRKQRERFVFYRQTPQYKAWRKKWLEKQRKAKKVKRKNVS